MDLCRARRHSPDSDSSRHFDSKRDDFLFGLLAPAALVFFSVFVGLASFSQFSKSIHSVFFPRCTLFFSRLVIHFPLQPPRFFPPFFCNSKPHTSVLLVFFLFFSPVIPFRPFGLTPLIFSTRPCFWGARRGPSCPCVFWLFLFLSS